MADSFISKKSNIGHKVIIGDNSSIYGEVIIGDNSIIESNVVIGHPNFDEINAEKSNDHTLNSLYDSASKKPLVIGDNCIIRSNTVIYSGSSIGHNFDCGHNVIIREGCVIGNNTYMFVNTELKKLVKIGNGCRLAGTICDRTTIGNFSSIYGHTVHKYNIGVGGYIEKAPIIGSGVIVGRETVIVGDIVLNDFCLISSNSVLLESAKQFGLYSGNPAKFIRLRKPEEYALLFDIVNNKK